MITKQIALIDVLIDNIVVEDILLVVDDLIKERHPSHIVGVNIDQLVTISKNKYSKKIFSDASLVFTDGKPITWLASLIGSPIKERITGPDLMVRLCERASQNKYRVFLLGSMPGVAAQAAVNLKLKFEGLIISGTYSPPYGFDKNPLELNKINEMLRDSNSDILFVGMGSPKQDCFIYENKEKYEIPVSFSMGAAIDFLSGHVKRAPRWMINVGLEWFYRMMQDPKRLVKRYLVDSLRIIPLYLKFIFTKKQK